ncbi:MAG: hypothetical protein ACHQSE_09975, partial [Gemmatimonadales bacterium]
MRTRFLLSLLLAAGSAGAQTGPAPGPGALSVPNANPFPSTYVPFASRPTVIQHVNIFTATGPLIRDGAILIEGGKVAAVGATV